MSKHAELLKRPHAELIHTATPNEIAKQYEEFSAGMKSQYFIKYDGRIYEGEDVKQLLDI